LNIGEDAINSVWIETGCGFVQDQQLRAAHNGAGYLRPPQLSAGQRLSLAIKEVTKTHDFRNGAYSLASCTGSSLAEL
jgi:hypothetical protein